MPFFILTGTVGLVTLLEAVDPGIISSLFSLPLAWLGLIAVLLRERQTALSLRMRRGLTIAASFFTIALVATYLVRSGSVGFTVFILAAVTSALLAWYVTDPSYAHASLPQDRPR